LFRAHGLLAQAGDAPARPAGQSTTRWQVLAALERAPITVAQIARGLALARQRVQRVAELLVDEGLTVHAEHPAHKRSKLLALTSSGRAALALIQTGQRAWTDVIGAEIYDEELRRAGEILEMALAALARQQPL
jgi:DNA-binding MarR family transcriptional regulator